MKLVPSMRERLTSVLPGNGWVLRGGNDSLTGACAAASDALFEHYGINVVAQFWMKRPFSELTFEFAGDHSRKVRREEAARKFRHYLSQQGLPAEVSLSRGSTVCRVPFPHETVEGKIAAAERFATFIADHLPRWLESAPWDNDATPPTTPRFTFDANRPYTRRDLRAVIGLNPEEKGGKVDTGYFQHAGTHFILCGIETAGRTGHDYGNRLKGNLLIWRGRSGARLSHKSIQRMVAPNAEVHVFHRKHDREAFTYAGRATARKTDDVVPVEITWALSHGQVEQPDHDESNDWPMVPGQFPDSSASAHSYFEPQPSGRLNSQLAPAMSSNVARKLDHAARDSKNRSLGRAGEQFVVALERKRLAECGRPDLAEQVEWVADTQGDGLGYDVSSFDACSGKPLRIEVKTTVGAASLPFYVTERELTCSADIGDAYRLYRVFNFRTNPRVFTLTGPLREKLMLRSVVFAATLQ